MGRLDNLITIPIGSLLTLPEDESESYFKTIAAMPAPVTRLLTSTSAGAFVRGLRSAFHLPIDQASKISLAIVRVAVGEKSLAQLPAVLAETLALPLNQAQRMSAEVAQDLFTPVRPDLEHYWRSQQRGNGEGQSEHEPFFYTRASTFPQEAPAAQARDSKSTRNTGSNVLDLKHRK